MGNSSATKNQQRHGGQVWRGSRSITTLTKSNFYFKNSEEKLMFFVIHIDGWSFSGCFILCIRLRTSGRWDTPLVTPSKIKGLSIGSDMLFQNHVFFGSKLKALCTYSTSATTSHPNHWKVLVSGSRFFDWAPSYSVKNSKKLGTTQGTKRKQTISSFWNVLRSKFDWWTHTGFVLGILSCRLASLVPFCISWQGFQMNARVTTAELQKWLRKCSSLLKNAHLGETDVFVSM